MNESANENHSDDYSKNSSPEKCSIVKHLSPFIVIFDKWQHLFVGYDADRSKNARVLEMEKHIQGCVTERPT